MENARLDKIEAAKKERKIAISNGRSNSLVQALKFSDMTGSNAASRTMGERKSSRASIPRRGSFRQKRVSFRSKPEQEGEDLEAGLGHSSPASDIARKTSDHAASPGSGDDGTDRGSPVRRMVVAGKRARNARLSQMFREGIKLRYSSSDSNGSESDFGSDVEQPVASTAKVNGFPKGLTRTLSRRSRTRRATFGGMDSVLVPIVPP